MADFEVVSADRSTRLTISPVEEDERQSFEVVIEVGTRAQAGRLVAIDRDRFVELWAAIASRWTGQARDLAWEARDPSVDYGLPALRLTARNDGRSRVTVELEMAEPYLGNDPWLEEFETHIGVPDSVDSGPW